jgi:hypothetical protein
MPPRPRAIRPVTTPPDYAPERVTTPPTTVRPEEPPERAEEERAREETFGLLARLWPREQPVYKRPALWIGAAVVGGAALAARSKK